MLTRRTLEVPLPERMELGVADRELLVATFQALIALRCEKDRRWEMFQKQLEDDGWKVRWGLTWRAEAKRGDDYEEATGATLDEALSGVAQLVRFDMAGRAP
ncbi:MAG TPA: hypothetical protein VL084_03885 [Thermoanaerobaculia bacterium]|nr:hypothetical protein [Thermoanaerobaculia bacterium]